jgi:outer membrane protein assembly factor BamB
MRASKPIGFLTTLAASAAAALGSTRRSRRHRTSRIAVLAVAAAGLGLLTSTPARANPGGAVTGPATVGCTGAPVWAGTLNLGSAPPEAAAPAVLRHVTLSGGKSGTIIVISTGAGTFGVNASGGNLVWSANDPCTTPPCPVLGYGAGTLARVIVGNGDPTAVELNAGTGQQIWSTALPAPVSGLGLDEVPVPGSPGKFSVQSVIVGDTAGDLDSLNPHTGVINWGDKYPGPVGEPAIANGVIYDTIGPTSGPAGTNGQLIALNGDGRQLFSADTGDLSPQPYPPAPPTVADGRVYVGDFTGGLRMFALPG